jgi:hypothetical protein
MQSGRDSSVWKSLAVAFGDGLAFGVGMKLSQGAARRPETHPQPELAPPADRLERIEQRIARIEQAPAPAPTVAAPSERQVLEAVVNAVDERLKEHAEEVQRRIAEVETKVALEVKSLSEQDEAVVSAVEEVQTWCDTRIAAIRADVPADIEQIVEERVAAQVRLLEDRLRGDVAEMRAELAAKNGEILELRRQIAESGCASRDLLMAISQACRDAAERVTPPAPPAASPMEPNPLAGLPAPAFAQIERPGKSWRLPMASSFMLTTAGLFLIRFL